MACSAQGPVACGVMRKFSPGTTSSWIASRKLAGLQSPAACATRAGGDSDPNFENYDLFHPQSPIGHRTRCSRPMVRGESGEGRTGTSTSGASLPIGHQVKALRGRKKPAFHGWAYVHAGPTGRPTCRRGPRDLGSCGRRAGRVAVRRPRCPRRPPGPRPRGRAGRPPRPPRPCRLGPAAGT